MAENEGKVRQALAAVAAVLRDAREAHYGGRMEEVGRILTGDVCSDVLEVCEKVLATSGGIPTPATAVVFVEKVTKEILESAAATDDLDDAIFPIMEAARIATGDVAGLFFTGSNAALWADEPESRPRLIREWLGLEAMCASENAPSPT